MILRRQPEDNTHERQTDSGVLRLRQLPVSQSRVTTLRCCPPPSVLGREWLLSS